MTVLVEWKNEPPSEPNKKIIDGNVIKRLEEMNDKYGVLQPSVRAELTTNISQTAIEGVAFATDGAPTFSIQCDLKANIHLSKYLGKPA